MRGQDLKPCPFCGGLPSMRYSLGKALIECANKKCSIKPSTWLHVEVNRVDELVGIWNKRE